MLEFGYSGPVFAVNPSREQALGMACYPSLASLPDAVDLAIVLLPAELAVDAFEEGCDAGLLRSALIVASGFAEIGESDGFALQDRLRAIAGRSRVPVLGPNVEGFLNFQAKFGMYAAAMPRDPRPGGVAVLAQSGAVVWYMAHCASDIGLGLRVAVGIGSEAVVSLGDLLSWCAADQATTVAACYFETIRDLPSLEAGLGAMQEMGKPVLICAPRGSGSASVRAVSAHTGAAIGNAAARDAWLRDRGAIVVENPQFLAAASTLFAASSRPKGRGVYAAMEAGGDATMFAEAADRVGLELPPLDPTVERELGAILPAFSQPTNPLDVTGQGAFDAPMYLSALRILARQPDAGVLVLDAAPPRQEPLDQWWARDLIAGASEIGRTNDVVVVSAMASPLTFTADTLEFLSDSKVTFLQGQLPAASAILAMLDYHFSPSSSRLVRQIDRERRARAMALLQEGIGPLDENASATLLSLYGLPRPEALVVKDARGAVEAWKEIGAPVAVKGLSGGHAHKQRLGLVLLDCDSDEVVSLGTELVLRRLRDLGADRPRVLVQRMESGAELLVGGLVDDQFGPVITVKPGGAAAEIGSWPAYAAPIEGEAAEELATQSIRHAGISESDEAVRSLAEVIEAISAAIWELSDEVVAIEINPVLVSTFGAVAADAMVERRMSNA
jgi:acetyl-CoA synthetase/acetyltransferase